MHLFAARGASRRQQPPPTTTTTTAAAAAAAAAITTTTTISPVVAVAVAVVVAAAAALQPPIHNPHTPTLAPLLSAISNAPVAAPPRRDTHRNSLTSKSVSPWSPWYRNSVVCPRQGAVIRRPIVGLFSSNGTSPPPDGVLGTELGDRLAIFTVWASPWSSLLQLAVSVPSPPTIFAAVNAGGGGSRTPADEGAASGCNDAIIRRSPAHSTTSSARPEAGWFFV